MVKFSNFYYFTLVGARNKYDKDLRHATLLVKDMRATNEVDYE